MCIYVQDIKFLLSNLWLGGLSADNASARGQHATDNYDFIGFF